MTTQVLGYQGIPTTRTVRECLDCIDSADVGVPGYGIAYANPDCPIHGSGRERTVVDPVYVVPQMLPCPCACHRVKWDGIEEFCKCGGSGVVAPPWPDYIATDCPECGGTGAEGYVIRYWDAHSWVEPCSSCAAGQVVAYKVTAIDELPVVDAAIWNTDTIVVNPEGVWFDDGQSCWLIDEAWAADLTPGQVVWRLHLEALDQPYTHVVERFTSDDPDDEGEERWDTAPLSVPVGEVADIELVDPKESTDG